MKRVLTTTLLFLLLQSLSLLCFAQKNTRFRVMNGAAGDSTSVAELFSEYDLSDVPTGFLLESGMPDVDLPYFDGRRGEEATTDFPLLYSIVKSVESIDVTNLRDWGQNVWNADSNQSEDVLPLWIALYSINSFSDDAKEYITYSNHHFIKGSSAVNNNLYESHTVVAFAPQNAITNKGSITFHCRLSANSNTPYSRLELDADDGSGFRDITANQKIQVYYSEEGVKRLRLRVYTSETDYRIAYSRVFVLETHRPNILRRPPSHKTDSTYYSGVFRNESVSAIVSSIKCQNVGHVFKPLIIVEGFDPIDLMSPTEKTDPYGFTSLDSEFERELSIAGILDKYDVYYVNWLNSEADIRSNALLLSHIIEGINQEKHANGSLEGNIVVAQSMGGLITQYALRDMERQGHPHEITYCYSHDVPYHGATVPLGVIYAIQSIYSYIMTTTIPLLLDLHEKKYFSSYANAIGKYLYGTSAQQMLANYVNPLGIVDHTSFNELQNELQTLGLPHGDTNYPIINIAISNGGSSEPLIHELSRNGNHYIQASASVTQIGILEILGFGWLSHSIYSLANLTGVDYWARQLTRLPGISHYHYSLAINPHTNNNQVLSHFVGTYTNIILTLPIQKTFYDDRRWAPSEPSLDLAFGSYYDLDLKSGNPLSEMNDTSYFLLRLFTQPDVTINVVPKIQFVPTFSSLRNRLGKETPTRDYLKQPLQYNETEFDGYVLPNTAQYHTHNFMWSMIDKQLNIRLDCKDTLMVGDHATLTGYTGNLHWVSSNNRLFSINESTGVVEDVVAECDVNVICYGYSADNSTFISRKKRIHIIPNTPPKIYMKPSFKGDTLVMDLHSPDKLIETFLRKNELSVKWFYKRDLEPLREFMNTKYSSFVIPNFSAEGCRYKITIAAHVNAPKWNLHDYFVDYTFWNNQRIHLVLPSAIVFSQDVVLAIPIEGANYCSIFNMPLVVKADSTPVGDYTDKLVTPSVQFRVAGENNGIPCVLNNDSFWIVPNFFTSEAAIEKLHSLYESTVDGDIEHLVVEVLGPKGGDPIQSFHIPVIRKDKITF